MQRLVSASASPAAADDNLINFLHRAPFGLVHLAPDGTVAAINPMAANLLMPLSSAGRLQNLFAALSEAAPQLQRMASDFHAVTGTVCEAIRVPLVGQANSRVAQYLFIGLFKLNATRFVATVSDAIRSCRHRSAPAPVQRRANARRPRQSAAGLGCKHFK